MRQFMEWNWQPIETAPKDGTGIFGYWPIHPVEHPHAFAAGTTYYYDGAWRDEGKIISAPTHWLPIPKLQLTQEI
jgi:hypothetical protein